MQCLAKSSIRRDTTPMNIWWIRRDLRLQDNQALQLTLQGSADGLLPVFILDPALLSAPAPNRQAFLWQGLRALDEQLRRRGSGLIVRTGPPLEVLSRLRAETGAAQIVAEEDYTPYARRRDAAIAAALPLTLAGGLTVHHPAQVCKADGTPYTVFTPFSKAWKALPRPVSIALAPDRLPPLPTGLASDALPEGQPAMRFVWQAGEVAAAQRLADFLAGPIADYADDRNRLDLDGTSTLSPYLRFGMISARQAALAAWQAIEQGLGRGAETWLNELIWREFYQAILYHFPDVLQQAFNPSLRNIAWRDAPEDLRAWQEGRTGYPVVDACMRQLSGMGWMHNRGRMIVASFLVKDLLLDWRLGERWFMRWLVDGDPAANNGGWQWTAGVGTDAAPYFRIFNPLLQGQKFDPQGDFVRRWLPELRRVPTAYIHTPWLMPEDVQAACGVRMGREYPLPIVNHAAARDRTLAAYRGR